VNKEKISGCPSLEDENVDFCLEKTCKFRALIYVEKKCK
jgi:hypothetical protein